jgi:hypothetical protein
MVWRLLQVRQPIGKEGLDPGTGIWHQKIALTLLAKKPKSKEAYTCYLMRKVGNSTVGAPWNGQLLTRVQIKGTSQLPEQGNSNK